MMPQVNEFSWLSFSILFLILFGGIIFVLSWTGEFTMNRPWCSTPMKFIYILLV